MNIKFICLIVMVLFFLSLWIIIHFRGKNRLLSRVFNIFVLNMAIWAFGLAMFYGVGSLHQALFWIDICYIAGGLIPPAFLLYSFVVTDYSLVLSIPRLILLFLPNAVLAYLFLFTPWMIKEVIIVDGVKSFVHGPVLFLWDINFNIVFLGAFYRFIYLYRQANGLLKEHLKYIILGTFSGYVLAGTTNIVLPWFGNFKYLWLGPPLTSTWLFFISYTIVKHRILDIRIVIARSAIFFLVYLLVLGLPIFIGYEMFGKSGPWLVPMSLMGILATVGPFVYLFIQKRAEDQLLQEQRRYQATLRQASSSMGKIKDLNKLMKLIVYIVTRSVRIDHALIYVHDKKSNQFVLGASKRRSGHAPFLKEIPLDWPLLKQLTQMGDPIVFEEIKQKIQKDEESIFVSLKKNIQDLSGELIFPILI